MNCISSFEETDNDVYFFEMVASKIIINTNYNGISILNSEFQMLRTINLGENFVVDNHIVADDMLVLFCSERGIMVILNVQNLSYSIGALKQFSNWDFFPYCKRVVNCIFVVDYAGKAATINLLTSEITEGCSNEAFLETMRKICCATKRFKAVKILGERVIVQMNNHGLAILDLKSNSVQPICLENSNFHTFSMKKGFLLAISESKAAVVDLKKETIEYFYPDDGVQYLDGKVAVSSGENCAFILNAQKKNEKMCSIQKFVQKT